MMKAFIGIVLFICITLNANAQLLWKVSGKGLEKPSYIMGTHHLAPLSIKDSIAGLQKALDETLQVYGELKMPETQTPAAMQKMQKMMMIESDTTLMSLLSPADFETASKFCKEYLKMDLTQLPKLKPIAIQNNAIVIAYIKHIKNFNPQEQLDTYFQIQAIEKGKKVEGLESLDFQFNLLFNSSSLKRQAELLMCMLNHIDETIEDMKRQTDSYMRQDLNTLMAIYQERKENLCDPLPGESEAMLDNRNLNWVKQLTHIMQAAPTFIAVGALHLPGEKGVLNLLKKEGYTVEPVK